MPAPKMYIGSREISELMCVSLREAQYIMAMFRERGRTVNEGRMTRVALKTFVKWLCEQDGSNATDTFNEFKQALKEGA